MVGAALVDHTLPLVHDRSPLGAPHAYHDEMAATVWTCVRIKERHRVEPITELLAEPVLRIGHELGGRAAGGLLRERAVIVHANNHPAPVAVREAGDLPGERLDLGVLLALDEPALLLSEQRLDR